MSPVLSLILFLVLKPVLLFNKGRIFILQRWIMAEYLEELEPSVRPNQSLNSTAGLSDPSSSLSLRHLPAIQLSTFSGKFKKWESFRDRFTSLIFIQNKSIQNKELSDFSRMHFLTSSLTGRARDAIASLVVTAHNFEVA